MDMSNGYDGNIASFFILEIVKHKVRNKPTTLGRYGIANYRFSEENKMKYSF